MLENTIQCCVIQSLSCIPFTYRYDIILSCWNEDVAKRPSFKDLQTSLNHFLVAKSGNFYVDFSINPQNSCYLQVVDEAEPPFDRIFRTESHSSKRSKIGSKSSCSASNIAAPLKEVSGLQTVGPRRYARTSSLSIEKTLVSNPLNLRKEGRRPRSTMLLQNRSQALAEDHKI